jgi:hypothetical protein
MGVVVITVGLDMSTSYLAERMTQPPKTTPSEQEVKSGITASRNLKKIELGLTIVNSRAVRVDRPRGAHRKTQASF